MYNMGWTGPVFFDHAGDELALQHAVSRYHVGKIEIGISGET